jgi:hypothetical protein
MHCANFAVARDRQLARRQQSFLDLTFRPIEEGLDFVRIQSDLLWTLGKEM